MIYESIRDFITRLDELGEHVHIKEEVDWNLEAAAIMRRFNETSGPAVLFEKIKGYPEGYCLSSSTLSTFKRLAIAMGLESEASYHEIVDTYIERRQNPIKPILVDTGPCKENIFTGEEVDLLSLPAPMVHLGDGGRFLGTWNIGVCRDPDSDWVNWGMYRTMVHNKNTTGIYLVPIQHIGVIYNKYESQGKPMEYAFFMGADPLCHLVGASAIPYGVSEVDIAGGLRQRPVELVKCETVDLMVPASAEIVVEGEILPHERKQEGPFGEYPGYTVSGALPRPIVKITAITHRNNPITTFVSLGIPVDEGHVVTGIGFAADIKMDLIRAGLPIKNVYSPPESALFTVVVSTETPYPHIAHRIASCIWANKNGGIFFSRVFVVNDDIDPSNMQEVIHAFATKCHPVRGTTLINPAFNVYLTPYLSREERNLGTGANVLYDCTWPLDWDKEDIPVKASFKTIYPKEIQEKVLNHWEKKYGKRE